MKNFDLIHQIRKKYQTLAPYLNEKTRRVWAAAESLSLQGQGGSSIVSEATGIARSTIAAGLKEIQEPLSAEQSRLRRTGGGRKSIVSQDTELMADLESLLEPATRGDPMSPLRWTNKSTAKLAEALQQQGHKIGARSVASLLHQMGYSLQSNLKSKEGTEHPDRDRQFRYISRSVKAFHREGQPVISVDAKKKELIGEFKNQGKEWEPKGEPKLVNVHDFPDEALGKAIPYGVYDLFENQGWVSVGITHDTAELAVETIRRWWNEMGKDVYPEAKKLMLTADSGGSNSYRSRLWKLKLQELADELGIMIQVSHFPPGTSKWNKIEHQLFCHITRNWRGRPLVSTAVIVKLIGSTTTKKGLTVKAKLDKHLYKTKIKVSDEDFKKINIEKMRFHGDWNYQIRPRQTS
jgi:transposase